MNTPQYKESSSQQRSGRIYPSKGGSQFKAPLGTQTGTLQAQQGQHSYATGKTFSSRGSQFKAPLGTQTDTLRAQNKPFFTSEAALFNSAPLYSVTSASQPAVQLPEKKQEQNGSYSPSKIYSSDITLQNTNPLKPLSRVQTLPSVGTPETYITGHPTTQKRSALTMPSQTIATDPYIGRSASHASLAAHKQRTAQFLREPDRSWQPMHPQTEPLASAEAPRKTKAHVMWKVILMVGTGALVGGIASFWLLRFPTYLVVTWAILIIVLSNLISREIRSYYLQAKRKPQHKEMEHPSTGSPEPNEDMERHPMLKDISDTTGYLKALCVAFKPGYPTQQIPQEQEYRV